MAVSSSSFSYFSHLFKILQVNLTRVVIALASLLLIVFPAMAHHPLGGRIPANFFEGFMSGIGHPILGIDHLAFVIAAGLIVATKERGIWVPITFVLASLVGAGIHLAKIDLPAPETMISASVLAFGIILAMGEKPSIQVIVGLGAIAGLFHGFAYGEGIFGAEMTPLLSYLIGFSLIQMVIALIAYAIGKAFAQPGGLSLRFAGFVFCGAGAAFLSSVLLG